MITDKTKLVRLREEVKRLQVENFELQKSRIVIEGVPERDHKAALDKIDNLQSQLSAAKARIAELQNQPAEKDQAQSQRIDRLLRAASEGKGLQRKVERLTADLSASREALKRLARKSIEKAEKDQARINELECKLRRLYDHQN